MSTIDHTGTLCAQAWGGLDIDSRGTVRPCCEFGEILVDDQGQEFNVSKNTLHEILNSHHIKQLRSQMLAGERPKSCASCWREQDAGNLNTLRHVSNQKISLDSTSLSTDAESIQSMGIALGNVCNLKCRICGPWASSSWAADEIKRIGKSSSVWEQQLLKQGAWPSKSDNFWNELITFAHNLKEVNLYGGEPFMSPGHLTILDALSNSDVSVTYNTNGTVSPEKYIEIFKKIKKVNVYFSIDDVVSRFEYQRKNAKWHQVVENINQFRKIPNIHCAIHCTVSVFNALYLCEIFKHFDQVWPGIDYQINVLQVVEYHSILHAPAAFKQAVKDRLQISELNKKNATQCEHLLSLMFNHPSNHQLWKDLKENIVTIDTFRKENIQDSHPELACFLGLNEI